MVKRIKTGLICFLLCFGMLSETSCLKAQDKLLLYNATIIDGSTKVRPYLGSVLIESGEIKKIYKASSVKQVDDAKTIDCTGKFIMPGLFDAHIHLATVDLSDWKKAKESTDKIVANMVRHGITTLRDMAGDARYLRSYNEEIQQGKKIGPAIFYAAQFAGPSYFEMYSRGSKKKAGVYPWERAITDTTDIAQVVREAKEAGVTGIKTYADLSKQHLKQIVKEARKTGLQIWSHATIFPIQPMDAAREGVNSLSHAADVIFQQLPTDSVEIGYAWQQVYKGMKVNPAKLNPLFQEMRKRSIYLDGTVYHATQNKLNYAVEVMKLAHQAGVKIVAGTDWIYPEDPSMIPLYDEARIYNDKVGLSTLETIESLTLNAALVTGLKDRGRIAKGYRADLLLLDRNPVNDIKYVFMPKEVYIGGRKVLFKQ